MKEKKYYYAYQITNKLNGRVYIGIHGTNNLNDGYMGSGKVLKKAQKKYGLENFQKDILCYCSSWEELLDKEIELVTSEFVARKDTYNLTEGGVAPSSEITSKWNKGSFFITDGSRYTKVKKNTPIPEGWWKEANPNSNVNKGKIYITDGKISKHVDPADPIPEGWYLGVGKDRDKIFITNGEKNKQIRPGAKVPDGWWRGKTNKKKIPRRWINDGGEVQADSRER
jgi:hypothetical protein